MDNTMMVQTTTAPQTQQQMDQLYMDQNTMQDRQMMPVETTPDPSMYMDPTMAAQYKESMESIQAQPSYTPEQMAAMQRAAKGGFAFLGTTMLLVFIAMIIGVIAIWKIFTKAGKPGWAALIPFYNIYVLMEIIGRPGWWALFPLLAIIPVVGSIGVIVISLIVCMDLAKSFGKSQAFGVVGLWLFSIIGYLVLGFGSAKYVGPAHTLPTTTPTTPASK